MVKLLLDTGKVDIGLKDGEGETPLSWAAKSGNEAVVKLLVKRARFEEDFKDYSEELSLLFAPEVGRAM